MWRLGWTANLAGALVAALLLATVAHAQDEPAPEPAPRAVRIQSSAGGFFTLTIPAAPISPTQPITALLAAPVAPAPGASYVVKPGDTLFVIARDLGVDMDALAEANDITDINVIEVGQVLRVPDSATATVPTRPLPVVDSSLPITARMTPAAQQAQPGSPFYRTTWLTYYGRPGIPLMGIMGEDEPITVTTWLRAQADAYDAANGPDLGVTPAYHLVYGMATKAPGDDGMHVDYLPDDVVQKYIDAALAENVAVILDVQISAYTPADSIRRALPFLQHPNVHLAIDPEFAMVEPGQLYPGNPIGYVTAEQVNEVQQVMAEYLRANKLAGQRVLLVHQFQNTMIVDKEKLDPAVPEVALTLSVDGFGSPYAKITKYNALVDGSTPFAAFKLFYDYDEPLLTEPQALGVEPGLAGYAIGTTPNMIIYQ